MAKLIPLTRDKFAIVDDDDFAELARYSWYAFNAKGLWYAARKAGLNDTDYKYRDVIFMHKQILNTRELIDHQDRNGLNNIRNNLRSSSYRQNNCNRAARGSSIYLGVQWDKARKRWFARCDGKFLGRFTNETEAAKAYDNFAIEQYGEFANLNFKA